MSAPKCERCGKFARKLFPVYCNPPEGGIDHVVCKACWGCAERQEAGQ